MYEESVAAPLLVLDDRIRSALDDIDAEGRTATAPLPAVAFEATETGSDRQTVPPARRRRRDTGSARPWLWGIVALLLMVGASGAALATVALLSPTSLGGSNTGGPEPSRTDEDGAGTPRGEGSDIGASDADVQQVPRGDPGDGPSSEPVPAPKVPVAATGTFGAGTGCPTGMLYIPARTIHIGQPSGRKEWPVASPALIAPLDVPPFCVDAHPRSRTQVGLWQGGAALSVQAAQKNCNWMGNGANDASPAGCVSRDAGADYCADMLSEGALPSLVQWEAIKRETDDAGIGGGIYRAWVTDRFPPAVLNRRRGADLDAQEGMFREPLKGKSSANGGLLWSWNRRNPDDLLSNLGFRCVAPPR